MGQFLAPETDRNVQFLAPEIVNMGQKNFWSQKLTKWFSFWGQKLYFMGEWNYIDLAFVNTVMPGEASGAINSNLLH